MAVEPTTESMAGIEGGDVIALEGLVSLILTAESLLFANSAIWVKTSALWIEYSILVFEKQKKKTSTLSTITILKWWQKVCLGIKTSRC